MHVVMISGSRNEKGRTAQCLEAIAKGLSAGKASSESYFLPVLKLERCRQCDPDGWGQCRREGTCIIEDDFQMLVDKLKKADAAVFATPVYFRDLSDSMRVFLDRLRRISFMRKDAPMRGIPAVQIALAGGGGGGSPNANFNMERILEMIGYDIVDAVNVRRQNFEMKLPMLEMEGKWLATKPTSGPPLAPPAR
jgi:multimeric flavodoxin WrbA